MITCYIRRAPKASRYSGWDAQHLPAVPDNPALDVRIAPQERPLAFAAVVQHCCSRPPSPVVWNTERMVPAGEQAQAD